jgi:hypothetical protein
MIIMQGFPTISFPLSNIDTLQIRLDMSLHRTHVSVRHQYNIETYYYIELCLFLKLYYQCRHASTCLCSIHHPRLYPCFIATPCRQVQGSGFSAEREPHSFTLYLITIVDLISDSCEQ